MRVLVTLAVEAEFAPWRKLRSFKRARVNPSHWSGGVEAFEIQIASNTVWVFLTGIGIKCFDFRIGSCFRNAGVNLVLSSGLAGSLSLQHRQNEIIAPTRVGTLRDAKGVPLDPTVIQFAQGCGATVVNTLLTADRVVETADEKKRLGQFGEAVDMESFHVASYFIDEGVRVGVVRTISDDSDQDLPVDFGRCLTSRGSLRIAALSKELLVSPSKLPALIKFGRQSRGAARKMAFFLDGLIERLTPEVLVPEPSKVAAR